jgi:hypothetical protein
VVDAWARIPAQVDVLDAGAVPIAVLTGAELVEEAMLAPKTLKLSKNAHRFRDPPHVFFVKLALRPSH